MLDNRLEICEGIFLDAEVAFQDIVLNWAQSEYFSGRFREHFSTLPPRLAEALNNECLDDLTEGEKRSLTTYYSYVRAPLLTGLRECKCDWWRGEISANALNLACALPLDSGRKTNDIRMGEFAQRALKQKETLGAEIVRLLPEFQLKASAGAPDFDGR